MTKKYAVTYWAADVRHATEIIEADSAQAALEIARGEWTSWDMEDTCEPYDPHFARAIEVDADECEIPDGELAEEEMDLAKIETEVLRAALGALLDWHERLGGWEAPCWAQAFAVAGRKSQFEQGEPA